MAINLKPPRKKEKNEAQNYLALFQNATLEDESKQQFLLKELQDSLPDLNIELNAEILFIRSYSRRPQLYNSENKFIILDDQLRRETFSGLESFYSMADRAIVSWTYFPLIYSEIISESGFKDKTGLIQCIYGISEKSIKPHLVNNKFIERPMLFVKMMKEHIYGKDQIEQLLYKASSIYPSFHEIGHYVYKTDNNISKLFHNHIYSIADELSKKATISDIDLIYWNDPSEWDPSYGSLKKGKLSKDEVNQLLRQNIIEELFCDWFAFILLFLSPKFRSVPAINLLEMIMRHLSWNQLLIDAEEEFRQISSIRKRWRGIMFDQSTFRQHMLLHIIKDFDLISSIFDIETTMEFKPLLICDIDSLKNSVKRAMVRRHFIRFLAFQHPTKTDVELIGQSTPDFLKQIYYPKSELPENACTHQPAEWGWNEPNLLRKDFNKFQQGRLNEKYTYWDSADELMPYVTEGYKFVFHVRQNFWRYNFYKEYEKKKVLDFTDDIDELIYKIAEIWRFTRLSHLNYLAECSKNDPNDPDVPPPTESFMRVCLDCYDVGPLFWDKIIEQFSLNTLIKDFIGYKCPKCGSTNTYNTAMLNNK